LNKGWVVNYILEVETISQKYTHTHK